MQSRHALFTLLWVPCAFGAFTPISTPDFSYTGATTLLPATLVDFSTTTSLTGHGQTVTFSTPLEAVSVPNGGWLTWNSPPNTESPVPKVLWTNGHASVTLTLSSPASKFGFEAEPNPFAVHVITAVFYHNGTVLGQVSQSVNGRGGALLEAASSSDQTITSVTISSDTRSSQAARS